LNWVKYLQHVMRGEYDEAVAGEGGHELPITNVAEPARLPMAG
jgi:hypothetical protein